MLTSASSARIIARVLAACALSILFTLPAEGSKAAPQIHTVKIKGMVFVPATLEVSVGDTVVWVNEDLVPHTATAIAGDTKVFDSGVLPAKATWKYVAAKSGTIPYVCLLHPTMKATLIVH